MRPEHRAFADGREPAAADVPAGALCEIRRRQEGRARSVRGRRDGRARPGHFPHKPTDLRGTRGLGGAQFRPHHHAVAGGPSQGARADAHARGRRRILADPRSDRHRGQPRPETAAYREVCDGLLMRIRRRFAKVGAASG